MCGAVWGSVTPWGCVGLCWILWGCVGLLGLLGLCGAVWVSDPMELCGVL